MYGLGDTLYSEAAYMFVRIQVEYEKEVHIASSDSEMISLWVKTGWYKTVCNLSFHRLQFDKVKKKPSCPKCISMKSQRLKKVK